ncbi:uncharacterized protein LOC107644909 isoform X2 [Arachis ipaensis]|uniref:uncharacterized protein LOC107644909 isoform X2 n=1 Tax=Arachis ipaensis TaxID=130454 RepID=UPI0007AFCECA|nr:uncharacterized protein LOC107644909 isoform X2 [Arachis ipaensis]
MNPFYSDFTPQYPYSPLNNYAWNIHRQPTTERYRNQINYGWQNMLHGGLNHSHFNFGDPTPPYGLGFPNDGAPAANFLLHQTARQINPFVAPSFQDDDVRAASFSQHQIGRRINRFATSPARPTNRVASPRARPTNRVASPRARPANPIVAPRARPFCEICGVWLSSSKNIEEHNKGRNHQNMLKEHKHTLKRHEKSEELRGIRRREREHVPNALGNIVDRSKTVRKSERRISVERQHKDYLGKFMAETSTVTAENAEGECRDKSVTRVYDSKRKIGGVNEGNDENKIKRIRRTIEASKHEGELRDNSVAEGCDSKPKPEGEVRHNSAAEGHDSKLKIGGTRGVNGKKIKRRRRVIKSSKSDTNAPSNCANAESTPQVPTGAPPEQPMPLQVLLPVPAVGSNSEPQIQPLVLANSEANVNDKSPISTDETNVQLPSSMSMEFNAPVNSSINNEILDGSCKVEEKMGVLDIIPMSIYVESTVQVPSAVPPQKPAPLLELSPLPPERLNSEPLIQPFVQVEAEQQASKDNVHNENQNPTHHETNVYLPSSISMEFDAPADSSTNTEISNENFIAKENMEVTTKLNIASVQENICFVCGDRGFEEALVYCYKCQIWARHRYCLDGPVIFTEQVIWFCEDCKPTVETCDSQNLEDTIQTRMEKTNFTKQIGEKNEFMKVCQPALKTVENTHVADLNLVELKDHVVAQPVNDPIWRGSLHVDNKSINSIITSINGLFAHLSDLACSLVSEETRRFPEKLSLDLFQRRAVWPSRFLKYEIDQNSIALYLFPDERCERDYDMLVDDIIRSDLAMRAVLEHVELLVFPSTVLPREYRRFKAKYYLWGVFKAKKT